MDIRDHDDETGQPLTAFVQTKLPCLLDGIDHVTPGVGESDHFRF
jgi:hypothetical protein